MFEGVTANSVKTHVDSYNSWPSMNWGVYLDGVLDNPSDHTDYREYSSNWPGLNISSLGSGVGWAGGQNNTNQWAMIKYSTPQTFTGLKMVKRENDTTQWVNTFRLEFS